MDTILTLVKDYGTAVYLLVFAYCALKSGSLPLFAGYAAQTGALDLSVVATATFAGGYLGDEARFALTRNYGQRIARNQPRIQPLIDTGRRLLDRYGTAYIFLYRYPKGMRTIGALPVGLTDMKWSRFTLLNGASAAVWTIFLVGGGYLFGQGLEQAVASNWAAGSVVLLVVFAGAAAIAWWRISALTPAPTGNIR